MALSFKLVFHGPVVDITYTAILVSVIFHELLAPYLLKGLLVDAGIIRREARVEA
jgi:NhaP-type Na+/H+ or K+/H+ antiporter